MDVQTDSPTPKYLPISSFGSCEPKSSWAHGLSVYFFFFFLSILNIEALSLVVSEKNSFS